MTALKRTVCAVLACGLLAAGCGGGADDQLDEATAAVDGSEDGRGSAVRFPDEDAAADQSSGSTSRDRDQGAAAAESRASANTASVPVTGTVAPPTADTVSAPVTATSTATSEPPAADTTTSSNPSTTDDASPPVTEATATSTPATIAPAAQTQPRVKPEQSWAPFASFEEVVLLHPSTRVERIGFHESNHDGARQMEPADSAIEPLVLESRSRDTGSRTAADIVVEPGTEIRSPVTGTVVRAGGYILYCRHNDDFVVIEPDAHPGWEVKLLHITGVMVSAGDRVEAGVTVLAPGANAAAVRFSGRRVHR